jgi:hypothetical protein
MVTPGEASIAQEVMPPTQTGESKTAYLAFRLCASEVVDRRSCLFGALASVCPRLSVVYPDGRSGRAKKRIAGENLHPRKSVANQEKQN